MSLFSSLARRAAARRGRRDRRRRACRRRALEWRGGQPVVAAHAVEPLPDGALVPSLTGGQHARPAGGRRRRSARVLERGRPPAARRRWSFPTRSRKVSLVRFEQVPPRARRISIS